MFKKFSVFFLLILVLAMALALPTFCQDNRYRIAVLPFDDGSIQRWWGNDWDVGTGVADELVTALLNTGRFRLIERERINHILREQNFGASGRVDPRSAARVGKILGVDYLVMGKITEFTTDSKGFAGVDSSKGVGLGVKANIARVAIDARLVDATSAEIIAAVTGRGEKKQTSLAIVNKSVGVAFGSNEFKKTSLGQALRDAVNSVAEQLAERAYAYTPAPAPAPKPAPAPAPKPEPPAPKPVPKKHDPRPTVAVLPFDDGSLQRWWGNHWDVGQGVSDQVITELVNTNKFRVIEREQLDKVLREQNFGASGRVDPRSAARIGRILGVQYLIIGKVTEFTTDSEGITAVSNKRNKKAGLSLKTTYARVAIDARMIDTSTAEIVAAVTGRGDKKQTNVKVVSNYSGIAFGSNEFRKTILGQALRDAAVSTAQQLADRY